MADRTWPVLYRKVTAGDTSLKVELQLINGKYQYVYTVDKLIAGNTYLTESLEPSPGGSVLNSGSLESLTLKYCDQPIVKHGGSEGAFTRIEMDDGSSLDIEHRSIDTMSFEAWSFSCSNVKTPDIYKIKRFLDKVGNHKLVQAVDPDGNVIFGKISGQYELNWFIRGASISFTIQQEPGVTSL